MPHVHAALLEQHVTWKVPERRTLKFVKRQKNVMLAATAIPTTTPAADEDHSSVHSAASARSKGSTSTMPRFSPF
ncbi:hypothetical protein ACA910_004269 [Epithemia clementina (nom. ined.)]